MTWHRSASGDDVRRVFVQRSPGEESIISLITHFSPGIQKEQSLVKEQLQRNRHTRAERAVCVMRKFKTSELGKKKERKGKLDCALRPGRRAEKKKRSRTLQVRRKRLRTVTPQYVPPMLLTGIRARTRVRGMLFAAARQPFSGPLE